MKKLVKYEPSSWIVGCSFRLLHQKEISRLSLSISARSKEFNFTEPPDFQQTLSCLEQANNSTHSFSCSSVFADLYFYCTLILSDLRTLKRQAIVGLMRGRLRPVSVTYHYGLMRAFQTYRHFYIKRDKQFLISKQKAGFHVMTIFASQVNDIGQAPISSYNGQLPMSIKFIRICLYLIILSVHRTRAYLTGLRVHIPYKLFFLC